MAASRAASSVFRHKAQGFALGVVAGTAGFVLARNDLFRSAALIRDRVADMRATAGAPLDSVAGDRVPRPTPRAELEAQRARFRSQMRESAARRWNDRVMGAYAGVCKRFDL